jgi:hypothetical protein
MIPPLAEEVVHEVGTPPDVGCQVCGGCQ